MNRLLLAAALTFAAVSPSAAAKTPKMTPLAPTVPAVQETPRADDPLGVSIHRLPNGLTVYLSPNKGLPRVTAWIAVRAGSKHDPADSTGMAHYLEHMLFKGTDRLGTLDHAKERVHLERIRALYEKLFKTKGEEARKKVYAEIDAENVKAGAFAVPNEIDKFYRTIGARGLNAFTSDEQTVYIVDLPSNRLEDWATVEAERFAAPVFRLFQSEIEAVYEEKNRAMDNAERILSEEVEKRLYKVHPYGQQPTLGTIEHLKNPSLEKMYAFYGRWYVPNNMAIALAGDFDRKAALELLRKRFGAWQPQELEPLPEWTFPKPKGVERYEVRYEAEEKVVIAWPTVPNSHADADALTMLDMVMDNSASGLFNLRLNQAQKVKSAGSHPGLYNDAGAWYAHAVPKQGQTLEEAEALLLETVEALKKGEFEPADLEAVITNFESGEKVRLESNESRAAMMTSSFVDFEPWERSIGRLDRLRKVTKEDVVRVAQRYLGGDRVTVYRRAGKPVIPTITKPSFTKLPIDPSRESERLKSLLARAPSPIEPRWLVSGRDYDITPIEGGRLYSAKNPYNDLFALSFRFDRGSRAARRLCWALDLLDLAGAGPYNADEFKKKLYALGTNLSYYCDEDSSGVNLSGLDRNLWSSLELMQQRFDWPTVEADALEKMKVVALGAREDEKKNPGAVHGALGELAMRGRESSVLARLTNAELKALAEGELKSLIRDFPNHVRRVGYVGNRPPREVAKLLATGRRHRETPARVPLRLLKPSKPRVLFTHRDMVQAQVGFFAAGEVYDPAKVVDQQFLAQYLGGGMSSLIFQEVRESRALAYSASGGHTVTADKGDDTQLWGRVGCQADKTPEAVELMTELLRRPPISDKRFRETAKAIEEGYRASPTAFRSIPYAVMDWEDQGLSGGDPRPARFERALAYTPADLEAFASRYKDAALSVWILGHQDRVGLDKLRTLGDFETKGLDALFPY
ncbi:MAG: insulinase family protein [Elusimicrobiota bacterium]|nr:insulinase family protein [Elusimicrobiota bacterium]